MARRNDDEHSAPRRRSPAKTPEERESMLVAMSLDRIEQQIADGNVSSQVLTHFAKLGSSRERLEQERLANENAVLRKKLETMEAAIDIKHLMEDALGAFTGYTGEKVLDDDPDEYYE